MGRRGGEWRRDLAAVGADLRPRYSVSEWTGLLWRERVLMAVVFAVVFALGVAGALLLPKTYVARTSLLVGLGQDYADPPRAGDAARGAIPQLADAAPSEVEILSSGELKRRVIRAVGLQALDPRLAVAWANAADGAQRRLIQGSAVRILTRGLKIDAAPDTGVVRLSFQHKNPQTAAAVLNALIDTYLTYRHDVLSDRETPLLAQEKAAFEARLARADAAYEAFQTASGVGDLPSEKASLAILRQSVLDARYKVEADLGAAQSRLAALSRSVQSAPSPVRQDLERQRIDAAVDVDAAARRRDELSRQVDEITARQRKLTSLESRYQDLSAERDLLQANLRAFAQREEEARAAQALAHGGGDAIRVVERAAAPVEGTSLRRPMFALAAVFAAFAAVCAGLMRIVLRRGFVTPESAGRVLDLPVLACAPLKLS